MSWRVVVVTGVAKLDLKMGFLVVRKESTTKIHISEIHTLIIESTAVSLTAALLNELIDRKLVALVGVRAYLIAEEFESLCRNFMSRELCAVYRWDSVSDDCK